MEKSGLHNKQDLFFWSLILYLFFEVVRAADVYSFLSTIHAQRISMLLLLFMALLSNNRHLKKGSFNNWLLLFCISLLFSTVFSYSSSSSWIVTNNYLKLVLFVFLINYCIETEFLLKSFIICLFLLVFLYVVLSIREYLLGQHVYTMGVKRITGWDSITGPNRLAVICTCFLPFSILMLKKESFVELRLFDFLLLKKKIFYLIVWISFPASISVILLTNSRSGFLLLITFCLLFFLRSKKKIRIVIIILLTVIIGYNLLPESSKHRYRSIFVFAGLVEETKEKTKVDEWSQTSAEGRLFGLKRGLEIFCQNPILGVGPGCFKLVSGNSLQAHNLIGQLFSETGLIGVIPFFALILSIFKNLNIINKYSEFEYISQMGTTIKDAMCIMVVGSFFAHTVFFLWWILFGVLSLLSINLLSRKQLNLNSQTS